MPFPCFWRRSSSYNLKHDLDGVHKTTVVKNDRASSRRKTVLRSNNYLEGLEFKTSFENHSYSHANEKKPLGEPTLIHSEEDVRKSSDITGNPPKENLSQYVEKIRIEDQKDTILIDNERTVEKANTPKILEDCEVQSKTDDEAQISLEKTSNTEEELDETGKDNLQESQERKTTVTIIIDPPESEVETKDILEETKEQEEKSEEIVEETEKSVGIENQNEQIHNQYESNFLTSLEVSTRVSPSSSIENLEDGPIKTEEFLSPERYSVDSTLSDRKSTEENKELVRRRSGVLPTPVRYDEEVVKTLVKYPKSESDEKFIKDAIAKNEFLSKVITGRRIQDVVDTMYFKEIKAKEKIIKEGTRGNHMYVAAEGEFEVTKKNKGVVNVMKPGDVFGELAILYNAKRFATVKSITAAKVWVIDGTVYQQLVKKSNNEEQEEIVSFLQNVPILNEAGLDVLKKVAGLLKPEFFETGSTIIKEGDEGDKFYIITAGSATVTTESNGFIRQYHKGNCFGEKALLEPVTRQATITADDPGTDCLTLTQKHFVDNFGKIENISKITMPSQPRVSKTDVKKVVNEYSHLDLSEFKILKTLGVGGFGRVEFIQHKKDPALTFALKCLKKYEMVQQEQQFHVINEMQIQMTCNSPFIIRLYKTFKDNKFIYFLMEVCLGGDLWSLLQRQPNKNFSEKAARFIGGCVLEALAYLHNEGFVYRDLKPENLLIDNSGYIKMTDFGFAKRLTPGVKSGTFAGTPEYLAPEIILNRGHDKAVDLWAYGIFIYELLNGKTPFRSNDPSYMKTYNNILNGLDFVIFQAHNSPKAKNLITKLLKKAPSERLGVEDIRTHKWFADFDWEKLRACKITSPFKPKLSSNVDCRYIDHFRRDNDIPPDENSWWDEYF